jgi:four helix bundle protein
MHNLNKLNVYQLARQNLRDIAQITRHIRPFGDIKNQIERCALSVVSNIAEGAGSNGNPNFIRFLGYARASNKELHAQLEKLSDLEQLNNKDILQQVDHVGAMLFQLISRISSDYNF